MDTVDLREYEPVDNSIQSLLGGERELSERFKRNYEKWVEFEVILVFIVIFYYLLLLFIIVIIYFYLLLLLFIIVINYYFEVMKRQTNWDQLLVNTRGITDMVV
ncbi:unnamed protein product [Anisakis simplex]|uniref:Uncharacterized protein n=1 Tax=Anisakis simplex TaxID=6269 RepID=A0A3P6NN67_ANISI|nr:unnamed protein product [Anisakis simplex]